MDMRQHAYNPSIIRFGDKVIQTFRWHPNPKQWRTRLAIVSPLDFPKDLSNCQDLDFPEPYTQMSHEDARLFTFQGKLCMSFGLAVFPGNPSTVTPCSQAWCELVKENGEWQPRNIKIPRYGNNNFQGQEKNHLYFEHANRLHFIYQIQPEQVVVPLDADGVTPLPAYKSPAPKWNWGIMRGGTQPLPYKGKWLRFFHSLLQDGPNRQDWQYFIGALVMEDKPPFKILEVSKKPIARGDEQWGPELIDCPHWKQNVMIPYGAITHCGALDTEVMFDVAIGKNDCQCTMTRVTEEGLNL